MKIINIDTQRLEQAFAEKAAAHFASNPKHVSFTDGDIEPGAYLALRWGSHERAVAVMKLDDFHQPVIYGDLVPRTADPVIAAAVDLDDLPF